MTTPVAILLGSLKLKFEGAFSRDLVQGKDGGILRIIRDKLQIMNLSSRFGINELSCLLLLISGSIREEGYMSMVKLATEK